MYKNGPLAEDPQLCDAKCSNLKISGVEEIQVLDDDNEQLCTFYDEDDCFFQFVYNDNDTPVVIRALESLDCPTYASNSKSTSSTVTIIILCIAVILLLLALVGLLVWKMRTSIKDQRVFEDEISQAKVDMVWKILETL